MSSELAGDSPAGLVSVVIPAYNASRTLADTLESVLAQTHRPLEVVVVNDGSTDATAQVLERYGDRVRSITQSNRGLPAARNVGCSAARGELIALMDSDDLCRPERVALQKHIMDRHPDVVLCSSDFSAFNEAGPVSASYGATYYSAIADAPRGLDSLYATREELRIPPEAPGRIEATVRVGNVYRDLAFGNFVHPPTVMFRRSVLACSGPADDALKYTSDWEWFVRMARCGPFAHVERPLLDYRISASQMSTARTSGGQVAVDVVRAADKIWAADPKLAAEEGRRVRLCTREFCFDAAYAMAERRKGLAARMLARSAWNGGVSIAAAKTLVRIALPNALLQLARSGRAAA